MKKVLVEEKGYQRVTVEEGLSTYGLSIFWKYRDVLFPTGGYSLGGAYSLKLSLFSTGFNEGYYRTTYDLDYSVRALADLTNIKSFLYCVKRELSLKGFTILYSALKERVESNTLVVVIGNNQCRSKQLKIDMSLEPEGIFNNSFVSAEEMFFRKVALASKVVDRRPKDKSDIFATMYFSLNGDLSKKYIKDRLNYYGLTLSKENKWVDLSQLFDSIKTFKPQVPIKGITMVDIFYSLQSFYKGLYDKGVSDDYIFTFDGGWRHR